MYTVFRIGKLKTWAKVSAAGDHNHRKRDTPNADPTKKNVVLKGSGDVATDVATLIGEQKIRSNAVLAVEVIISASPEYFRPKDPSAAGTWQRDRTKAWFEAYKPWIAENFPHAASVVLHLDEATPHFQIIDVPLDEKGKLNARAKYGGAETLRDWQTRAAQPVEHLSIKRGVEGSLAKHTDIKDFYAAANKPSPTLPPVKAKKPEDLPEPTFNESYGSGKAKRKQKEKEHDSQLEKHLKEVEARNAAAVKIVGQLSDKANSADIAQQQAKSAQATADRLAKEKAQMKTDADKMRALNIGDVLTRLYGGELDKDSKTEHATQIYKLPSGEKIGVTGDKWYDNSASEGGKGAINLVMHLENFSQDGFKKAVRILAEEFDTVSISAQRTRDLHDQATAEVTTAAAAPMPLPEANEQKWGRVRQWLNKVRGMPDKLIQWLHAQGLVYADSRANAVFQRSENGVFLRGTGDVPFKRTMGGKGEGAFVIPGDSDVYLCEGPVDAMALKAVYKDATVIAVGGNLIPMSELTLPANAERIFAAFDRDAQGNKLAAAAAQCFGAERCAPLDANGTAKDWAQAVRDDPTMIDPSWTNNGGSGGKSPGLKLQ